MQFFLNALHEMNKRENETVVESNIRFQRVPDKIIDDRGPNGLVVFLYYMNSFDPHFGFLLKEKELIDLEDAKPKD